MVLKENVLIYHILLIIILYMLQGYVQGIISCIPLYLSSYKATWEEQSIFSCVYYPFSLKIVWAPILDSIYSYKLGRYITWLIPIQILIGIILIIVSFYLKTLLINIKIIELTIIFFFICLLISSQDIVVDGWSVLLFSKSNPQWASTCQTIGQVIGYFIGSTFLMTFESSNFMNKYIRKTFSLPEYSSGLFSFDQFIYIGGLTFIIISLIILSFILYSNNINKEKKFNKKLDLFETYTSILNLFKKDSIRQLTLILISFDIGFAATNYMTQLILSEHGITLDTIALLNIPSILIHILVPLYMSQIQHPLIWFANAYIPRLIISILILIYIYFIEEILDKWYFYPILILLFCLNQTFLYIMVVSRVGFSARISEPDIAATYMTLLATISNFGQSLLSTFVFYIANYLPKSNAYFIEVGICVIIGFIWIKFFWNRLIYLDKLPIQQWYLKPSYDLNITIGYEDSINTVKYN